MRWLFVIARNSSFAYKGRAVDVKQVGRELGVRYILEGSVRKASNRHCISGQLIESYATGLRVLAASYALGGRLEEAQRAIARLRQVDPTLRVSSVRDRVPLRRPEDVAKFAEGLRLAGLPE
jgi:hypothetical protein